MAIFSLHHSPIGKSTQAQPYTAAAHINYITRRRAMSMMQKARLPGQNSREVAEYLKACEDRDRVNARVIDKVMLALPVELSAVERAGLVREFAEHVTQGRAPWLAAFHDKGKDARNPHCHLVIRDRCPETNKRVIGTSEIGSTQRLRESWELFANRALERAGRSERIDRRTLADQGIDREPTIHEGPRSQAMDKRGARPRSRQRRLRNRPGARRSHRNVDYRQIDKGKSRPQVNRMRRDSAQQSEREYWDAIDRDNQARELQDLAAIHKPGSMEPVAPSATMSPQVIKQDRVDASRNLLPFKPPAGTPGLTPGRNVRKPALKPPAKDIVRAKPKDKLADTFRPKPRSFATRGFTASHDPSVRPNTSGGKGSSMSDDQYLRDKKAKELKRAKLQADNSRARYDDLMQRSYLDPKSAEEKMNAYRAKKGDEALYEKLADNSRKTNFGRRPGSIASRDGYTEGAPERRQGSQIARQYLGDATKDYHKADERLRAAKAAYPQESTEQEVPDKPPSRSRNVSRSAKDRDERALARMREERKNDRERER